MAHTTNARLTYRMNGEVWRHFIQAKPVGDPDGSLCQMILPCELMRSNS
jgi:hypothetical protein